MIKNKFDEIMPENFPNIRKETDIQVPKEKRVPKKDEAKEIHTNIYNYHKMENLWWRENSKGSKRKT